MAFNGKYKLQSQENFVPFMQALGIPDYLIEKGKDVKSVTEIVQTGDHFKATETKGNESIVNEFTIGEEMEVPGPTGEQIKGLVNAVGNKKLLAKMQNITAVIEIIGDQLVITGGSAIGWGAKDSDTSSGGRWTVQDDLILQTHDNDRWGHRFQENQ